MMMMRMKGKKNEETGVMSDTLICTMVGGVAGVWRSSSMDWGLVGRSKKQWGNEQ